jgi:hypothetical protein
MVVGLGKAGRLCNGNLGSCGAEAGDKMKQRKGERERERETWWCLGDQELCILAPALLLSACMTLGQCLLWPSPLPLKQEL